MNAAPEGRRQEGSGKKEAARGKRAMGLELWEYALIAAGAIWGAWLCRNRKK
jgi:hypothetical protein